ncbi:MAG: O-antigen ligase family protein [Clostridia bacterium]|nr:O-antigen ligase family protein [Clostridia bacterium]
MVKQKLQHLAQNKVMRHITSFFNSYAFPAVYAGLAFICSLFGLEVAFYALTALIAVFCCLFCEDSKPLLSLFVMAVFSTSWKHTPQYPYLSEFFYNWSVRIYLIVIGVILIASFIFKMAVWGNGKNFFKHSRLRLGIILLTVAFLLNGVFYSGYTVNNLAFGALIALSFFAAYIFFFSTLDINGGTAKYVAYILVLAAGVVFLQIIKLYIADGVIADGSIDKDLIKVGWGMSNNAGAVLAIFMPACYYLALKVKRGGWALYVLPFVYFGGICLTLSRTSVLFGGLLLMCAFVFFCIKKTPFRKFVWIFNAACVVIGVVVAAVLRDYLKEIFAVYFERGFSDMGRFEIWLAGLKNFIKAPVFGVGFYEPIDLYDIENWVFPDMYHNMFIQVLACCGVVGIISLLVHLVQVAMCVNRKPAYETGFYVAVIVMIICVSLLDNHIFHVYPAMYYSIFILLLEDDGRQSPLWRCRGMLRGKKSAHIAENTEK